MSTVGSLVFVGYFVLGDGPVGKGRTVGKMLTGIRVSDLEGKVPSLLQSLTRNVILFSGILLGSVVSPWVLDSSNFSHYYFFMTSPIVLTFSLFVATVLTMVFNPFKQGLHDFVAKTLVRPSAAPSLPFEEICLMIGVGWRRYQKQPQLMGVVSLGLIMLFFALGGWQNEVPSGYRQKFAIERQMIANSPLLAGSTAELGVRPPYEDITPEAAREYYSHLFDATSTETLHLVIDLRRFGHWPLNDLNLEPEVKQFAQDYHRDILGAIDSSAIFRNIPEDQTIHTFRTRPMVLKLNLIQYISLPITVYHEIVQSFTYDFDPMDPLASNVLEEKKAPIEPTGS